MLVHDLPLQLPEALPIGLVDGPLHLQVSLEAPDNGGLLNTRCFDIYSSIQPGNIHELGFSSLHSIISPKAFFVSPAA